MSSGRWDGYKKALRDIAESNGGLLTVEAVVNAARVPGHPLHGYFTWDDSHAAELWRRQEARHLIQYVTVVQETDGDAIETRAFVSLLADRTNGDGYRSVTEVMAVPELRSQYVEQVLHELNSIRRKYAAVSELAKVWTEIDQATADNHKQAAKAPGKRALVDTIAAPMLAA